MAWSRVLLAGRGFFGGPLTSLFAIFTVLEPAASSTTPAPSPPLAGAFAILFFAGRVPGNLLFACCRSLRLCGNATRLRGRNDLIRFQWLAAFFRLPLRMFFGAG